MTEIHVMTKAHPLWEDVTAFAEKCSWRAGPALAEMMRKNAFLEWERVFAAVEDGCIAGFCTLAEKDELPEKYDFSPFAGFVFVDERFRGKRLSEKLIEAACVYAASLGFRKLHIMSGEQGLYEKYGFRKIGDYETIYGTVDQLFEKEIRK